MLPKAVGTYDSGKSV